MTLHNSPNGPYVIQANTVNAEVLRQVLNTVTAGQTGIVGINDLLVSAHGTPNMSVDIAAGFGVIAGTQAAAQGSYQAYNDAVVNIAITTSDPVNPRIDLVSLVVQDNQYGVVGDNVVFKVTAGTPAGSPVAPAAPASSLSLAQVTVPANATTIVAGNVQDVRVAVRTALKGTLGYSQTISSTTGITSIIDLGVATTVTVVAGHRIRITGFCTFQSTSGTAGGADLYLFEGASALAYAQCILPTLAGGSTVTATVILTPTAGSHTYKLRADAWGSATVNAVAAGTNPTYIMVEDCGF